jgi:uncharacterized protein YbbK (DUF523 family)
MGSGPDRAVIIVSACLLGAECNHRGTASPSPAVRALARSARLIPVCPEVAGGLPTPRPPAELQADGTVRTEDGVDVTDFYRRGASHTVEVARAAGASRAVLKARSPSCGCREVYDGTYSRSLRAGMGVAAAALRAAGLDLVSDEDVAAGGVGALGQAEEEAGATGQGG